MHCYRDGSCFYYCESTFNIVFFYLLLTRCKFTLNCYFCFLTFLFRFLILSCAFEHFMEFAHYKCFVIIIIIIIIKQIGDVVETSGKIPNALVTNGVLRWYMATDLASLFPSMI